MVRMVECLDSLPAFVLKVCPVKQIKPPSCVCEEPRMFGLFGMDFFIFHVIVFIIYLFIFNDPVFAAAGCCWLITLCSAATCV